MEVLLHHVSYADVYFHLRDLDTNHTLRLRAHRERLERLCRKVNQYIELREHEHNLQCEEVGSIPPPIADCTAPLYRGDTGEQDKFPSPKMSQIGSPKLGAMAGPAMGSGGNGGGGRELAVGSRAAGGGAVTTASMLEQKLGSRVTEGEVGQQQAAGGTIAVADIETPNDRSPSDIKMTVSDGVFPPLSPTGSPLGSPSFLSPKGTDDATPVVLTARTGAPVDPLFATRSQSSSAESSQEDEVANPTSSLQEGALASRTASSPSGAVAGTGGASAGEDVNYSVGASAVLLSNSSSGMKIPNPIPASGRGPPSPSPTSLPEKLHSDMISYSTTAQQAAASPPADMVIGFRLDAIPQLSAAPSDSMVKLFAEAFFDGDLQKARKFRLTALVFPVFALGLESWLESIVRRRGGCDFLKIYFLSGSHQRTKKSETFSTESAAKCLVRFAERQLRMKFGLGERVGAESRSWMRSSQGGFSSQLEGTQIVLRCIHSGPGVFLYDENVRFMNNECLPHLDTDRQQCVRHFRDDPTREWAQEFAVSFILAEGAPARVSAITQSLHQFRPNYVHILRPKSYRDEPFLRADGVQVLPFDKASTVPAMRIRDPRSGKILDAGVSVFTGVKEVDVRINSLIKEMMQHKDVAGPAIDAVERMGGRTDAELATFWLRKTRKPVLCVLMVQKPEDKEPVFYRGLNLEVSMPTGSLCAERNCIGQAVAADPTLRREHIKLLAVLSLPMIEVGGSSGGAGGAAEKPNGQGSKVVGQPHDSKTSLSSLTGVENTSRISFTGGNAPNAASPTLQTDGGVWSAPSAGATAADIDRADALARNHIASNTSNQSQTPLPLYNDEQQQTSPVLLRSTQNSAVDAGGQHQFLSQNAATDYSPVSNMNRAGSYNCLVPQGLMLHPELCLPVDDELDEVDCAAAESPSSQSAVSPANWSTTSALQPRELERDSTKDINRMTSSASTATAGDINYGPTSYGRNSGSLSFAPDSRLQSERPQTGGGGTGHKISMRPPTLFGASVASRRRTRTADLNPINPCGACMEWLRKISEKEPSFRVITFDSVRCEKIYVKRIDQI